MADKKIIAVTGATGVQGGGLVRAILADPNSGFAVRAITRDPNKDKAKELAAVLASVQSQERTVPDYLSFSEGEMKGTFVRGPKLADVPYPVQMEPNLVVEFYSR